MLNATVQKIVGVPVARQHSLNIHEFKITAVLLLCTEDDNSCYRNVCKMSVVSFALAVVFIIREAILRKKREYYVRNKAILRKKRDYALQTLILNVNINGFRCYDEKMACRF